ncbi:MAG: prenyltransferase/squalene oxidase repeat-containing protein [Phycisphaerae bacterium]
MPTPGLDTTLAAAREHLFQWRTPAGHWEGHLASSALATATAVWALHVAERDRGPGPFSRLVQPGLDWLARHQNRDGGWGDTVLSRSNLSTTVLAWSALAASDGRDAHSGAARRAEAYVARAAGDLAPGRIADAVVAAYGADRTFSAPILMTAAQAGRLGPEAEAWRRVPALPFELAALPPAWWKRLRMQVVSYALPALIAIGQARYRRAPPRCPLRRLVRRAAVGPTLRRLAAIQPASGGFLEAVPLTSFVTMALAAAGQAHQEVAGRCIAFLARAVREDGAWPIDTNLATWVTTLSVQALAAGEDLSAAGTTERRGGSEPVPSDAEGHPPGADQEGGALSRCRESVGPDAQRMLSQKRESMPPAISGAALSADDRRHLVDWLLDQQHTEVHPYTRAEPGGWAWTDLAGGVPDADDTAGALLALAHLVPDDQDVERGGSPHPPRRKGERAAGTPRLRSGQAPTRRASASVADAAADGVRWLLGLQNADGGVPTFCRGWGRLPFDRSSPDLTAHALAAWSAWRDRLPAALRDATDAAAARALAYLARTQRPDGAWVPLWFGNEHVADETNPTYGTARVVSALAEVAEAGRAVRTGCCSSRPQERPVTLEWRRGSATPDEDNPPLPRRARPAPADAFAQPDAMASRGVAWLLSAQQKEGGWGGDGGAPPSVEETALATEALARWAVSSRAGCGSSRSSPSGMGDATADGDNPPLPRRARTSAHRGAAYLSEVTRGGTALAPAPIGFYFARLWYFERLYPVIFTVGALAAVRALGDR